MSCERPGKLADGGALSPTHFLEEAQKRWSRGTQSKGHVPEAQVCVSLCVMHVHTRMYGCECVVSVNVHCVNMHVTVCVTI